MISLLTITALGVACGQDEAAADERRVCVAVQRIVDALNEDRSAEAIVAMDELQAAVGATGNDAMARAGGEFFEVLDTDVDRWQLTMDETAQLGRQYHRQSAAALNDVVVACEDVDQPIDGLVSA